MKLHVYLHGGPIAAFPLLKADCGLLFLQGVSIIPGQPLTYEPVYAPLLQFQRTGRLVTVAAPGFLLYLSTAKPFLYLQHL